MGKWLPMVSVRTALLLGALVVFLPFIAATGLLIRDQAQESERQIGATMLAEATTLAGFLEGAVAKGRDALSALSETRYIDEGDFASLHEAASRIASGHDACLNIVLFRNDGQQMLNTVRKFGEPLPNTYRDSAPREAPGAFSHLPRTGTSWVQQAFQTGRPVMSDVYFGPVVGGPVASLAVPVLRGGQVVYVWIYGFDLRSLQKSFAEQVKHADMLGAVVDRRGIIAMRDARRSNAIGQSASQSLKAVVAGDPSAGSNRGMTNEGVAVYRAFAKTSDGWTVAVGRPLHVVNQVLRNAASWWAVLSVASLLFGALLVYWLTKLVAGPLQKLACAAPQVQEGRMPPIHTGIREIGLLRDALSEAARARRVAVRLSLLEGLVRHAPVAIALFDRDLRFVLLNERAAAAAGLPIEAHIGKAICDVMGRSGDVIEEHLRKVRDTGEAITAPEIAGETPARPGAQRWWMAHYFPVANADGMVMHIGATALEITELKDAERKLREADQRKDVYLATLAHELRNPLAPIRNAVAILRRKGPAEPELVWARDVIDRQAAQMARLLDELMDVSRITQGKLELRKAIFDLREAVRDGLEMVKPALEQNDQTLRTDMPEGPVWVHGDRVRLSQVFVNLLSNAAKYTERRGRVGVHVAIDGSDAVANVEDDGLGIAGDMIDRVFEPFSQSERTLHKAQGGLGIGLALVKGIVQLHGGSITARSAGIGKGSTFALRLPLSGAPIRISTSDAQAGRSLPSSMRILVADDNRDAADSLAHLLRGAGARVTIAYDGIAALDSIRRESPDVVVMDIGMPGMNGYDVARAVTAQPAKPFLIALTGFGQDSDRATAVEAGFNRHLTKPVRPEELLQILAELATAMEHMSRAQRSIG